MYIAIAGNIGSGKTTLTEMLTERYGAKAYYEQSDNPYIGDFYNDMNRWSFNLQMYFSGQPHSADDGYSAQRSGRYFSGSDGVRGCLYFRRQPASHGADVGPGLRYLYEYLRVDYQPGARPDLLIYLKASVPTLISQIRRRGRAYEMNIDEQYLRRLNDRYDDWIENIYRGEVLVIDMIVRISSRMLR